MANVNLFLAAGALLSATAALAHIGCIIFGAPWYRFFGAGEQLALLAEQGSLRPTLITLVITTVLATWSLYALSGAGIIGKLPLLKLGLSVITGVYLLRGLGGFYFISNPIGRSPEFWIWSSIICLIFGLVHFAGLIARWEYL